MGNLWKIANIRGEVFILISLEEEAVQGNYMLLQPFFHSSSGELVALMRFETFALLYSG